MAPSKTTKNPRAAPAKTIKTPVSKKKLAPNASILSFFKKAPVLEESMFVGDAGSIQDGFTVGDLYDDEPIEIEERYNEVAVPVKKRKLSDAGGGTNGLGSPALNGGPNGKTTPPSNPPKRKPSRKGPFIDESDSEEEENSPQELKKPVPERLIATQEGNRSTSPDPKAKPSEFEDFLDKIAQPTENVPELKHEYSTNGDFGEFADMDPPEDEDFEGEEYRERKFMEEQARLEAEEAGNYSCDDGVDITLDNGDAMEECCPICSSSLAGLTPDQATIHVNACLDGNPTPLPERLSPKKEETTPPRYDAIPTSEVSKRFARAAQPRLGQTNPISLGSADSGKASSNSAFTKLMSGHAEDAAWATAAAAEHASRGKPAYRRTCPFYKIMPGFFICVDAFRYGAVEGCRAYFLSHFHSDHYVGLTANWSHGPIYCSKVTGSLVKSQLKTAAKWVVELEFEETVEVPGTEGVKVTMIPANHCPGSSLFLFAKGLRNRDANANGGKGLRTQRILHCGDFRACPAHVAHPILKPETVDALTGKTRQQKIDVCYLDTTYLNPRYSFPPQEDVINACADLCASLDKGLKDSDDTEWNSVLRRREGGIGNNETVSKFFTVATASDGPSDKPAPNSNNAKQPLSALSALGRPKNRLLVVCGTYSIGKERICKAIALRLGTKIFASPSKIRIVAQLGDPELTALMTCRADEAQVHMQMLMEIRADTLAEYLESYRPHFSRVVGFRPSGWNYRPTMANNGANNKGPAAAAVGANLPPSSVPITSLLHGPGWRTRFGSRDLVPQRGSSGEAMCFGVPYSEHSSFRELALFIMALRIERVVPTVNVGSEQSRRRMKGWLDRWMGERRRGGVVRVLEGEEDQGSSPEGYDREGKKGKDRGNGNGVNGADDGNGKMGKKDGEKNGVVLWDGKDGRGGGAYW